MQTLSKSLSYCCAGIVVNDYIVGNGFRQTQRHYSVTGASGRVRGCITSTASTNAVKG